MRILAIDPGLRITGYCCLAIDPARPTLAGTIVEAGCLRFDSSAPIASRLIELNRDLTDLIGRTAPTASALEGLFSHYEHPKAALVMAHARGIILHRLASAGLEVIELAPASVKKAVAGTGQATKAQVASAVAAILRLPEPPTPTDISDAMAIAIAASMRVASA